MSNVVPNGMCLTIKTTDNRYNHIIGDEWWDTTGIDIVDFSIVNKYLEDNPRVGLMKSFESYY